MLLAHDLGTTGNKATLHEDDGRIIAAVTESYDTRYGQHGVVEQDPADWWRAVGRATRRLLSQTETPASAVAATALSGQMMGVVLLGADGLPVRPSIIWADTRSGAQTDRLVSALGAEHGYEILGHRLNPTYSLTKLMWLRDHEPEAYGRGRKLCLAKDYVVFRLTGVLATDPSDASSTNAFDQTAGDWSDELLAAADLPRDLFPDIVASTAVVGHVTAEAAEECGLLAGTPVVMGGGDGPMAAVGAGVIEPSDGAYAYLGTSSWISFSADKPVLDLPEMRTMTFNHVVPGRYVPTATMQAGGGSLGWVSDLFAGREDVDRFDRLIASAAAVDAAAEDLYFLPYLLGERSPYWNPAARGALIGLGRHHGQAHLTRAVLEGVAFNLATCIDAFRQHGQPVERVDAIGGGAASAAWLQILADVWGCVVRRRSVVEEANSLGAAITAGVGIGLFGDFSVARSLSEVVSVFEPDPDRNAAYRVRHERFVDAYARLEPWFGAGA
ncbi:MAG: xylulokinase [Propionibacteriaceae bacterium]